MKKVNCIVYLGDAAFLPLALREVALFPLPAEAAFFPLRDVALFPFPGEAAFFPLPGEDALRVLPVNHPHLVSAFCNA